MVKINAEQLFGWFNKMCDTQFDISKCKGKVFSISDNGNVDCIDEKELLVD